MNCTFNIYLRFKYFLKRGKNNLLTYWSGKWKPYIKSPKETKRVAPVNDVDAPVNEEHS